MLMFPADWVQHFGVNLATAYPPQGGGRFRYYERLRPLRSHSLIVRDILASDPSFRVHHIGETLRMVTTEGEYGASTCIEGMREGGRARHYIGAVFMEEFAAVLDCIVIVPSMFEEFEQRSHSLLRTVAFGCGNRPRPYLFTPPPAWQSIPSGLTVNYYPLDFPNNLTNIVVQPATPTQVAESQAAEAVLAQGTAGLVVDSSVSEKLVSAAGYPGTYLRIKGHREGRREPIFRELAVFCIKQYLYQLRLETTNERQLCELRAVFRSVVESVEPLPSMEERQRGLAFSRSANLFDQWTS